MKTKIFFVLFMVVFLLNHSVILAYAAPAARITIRSEQVETDTLSFTRKWVRLRLPGNTEKESTLNTLMSDESRKGLICARTYAKKNRIKVSGYQEPLVCFNEGKLIGVIFTNVIGEKIRIRYATYRTDTGREVSFKNLFQSGGGHFDNAVLKIGSLIKNRGDPDLERGWSKKNVLRWSFYLQEDSQSLVLVSPTLDGEPERKFSVSLSQIAEDLDPELKISV